MDGYESNSAADFGSEDGQDFWETSDKYSIRHHRKLRQYLLTPCAEMQEFLKSKRYSEIKYVKDNKTEVIKDDWDRASASKEWWTGKTVFANQRFDE